MEASCRPVFFGLSESESRYRASEFEGPSIYVSSFRPTKHARANAPPTYADPRVTPFSTAVTRNEAELGLPTKAKENKRDGKSDKP